MGDCFSGWICSFYFTLSIIVKDDQDMKPLGRFQQKPGNVQVEIRQRLEKETKTIRMKTHKNTSISDSDAVFLGWQETLSGKAIALYNITVESHPSYGSTVTDGILRDLNLQIPKWNRTRGKR
jgi:hypothetical protein